MKNSRKIIAIILIVITLFSFSACKKNEVEETFYTKIQSIDENESYDFEVSGKIYLNKTEEVVIADAVSSTVDEEKKENVTTENCYNVRFTGTYISPNEWVIKVFAKDIDTKGYTNITNLYRKADDVYVDVYSMVDSLDYLLEAEGLLLNQFDFSKGNYAKTSFAELQQIIASENADIFKNNALIQTMSSDFRTVFEKTAYSPTVLDDVFDALVTIAREVESTVLNTSETETQNEDKKDDPITSFSSSENNVYQFVLDSKQKETASFISLFKTNVLKDLSTKIKENSKDSEGNEVAVSSDTTKFIESNNWLKEMMATSNDEIDCFFESTIETTENTKNISIIYNHQSETEQNDMEFTIKLTSISDESITLPQNINAELTNVSDFHQDVSSKIVLYFNNELEDEEKDLTPHKIVSIGKLVKPAQNKTFKYKVYDRYVSISKFVGSEKNVIIPDEIEGLPVYVIEAQAFKDSDVSTVKMSDNIIIIGNSAFEGCKFLSDIKVSKNVEDYPQNFLSGCENLKKIDIAFGVKTINNKALYKCESLTEVLIPATVSLIGNNAFANCTNIKTIVVMDGTIFDENSVYVKTVGLTIQSSAFNKHSAKTIVLPQTISSIAPNAFTHNKDAEEPMFYGYTPSKANSLCAEKKYLFTVIALNSNIDKALKSDSKSALSIAKTF